MPEGFPQESQADALTLNALYGGLAFLLEDARSAVTDSWGRVHGTPGLWIGDASLFPSSCKVNPQITIMALATRLADRVAGEL